MITVNLRPGSKRAKAGPSLASGLAWTRGLGSAVKDPLRLAAVAAWIAVAGFLGWSFLSTGSELGRLEPQVTELRAEHARFQDFLAQKRREEAVRDSILAQVQTIRTVDAERFIWPHILDDVARALPPFTWLIDMGIPAPDPALAQARAAADTGMVEAPQPVEVQLTGRTVDIQGYTRFMRALEESPFLGNIQAPVFVCNYPKEAKDFYMKENPQDPRTVLCDDLLAPEGYGEIIGGSQLEDDLDRLKARIEAEGLPLDAYAWYLDLRRNGTFPHAGFGMGLERLVAWVCGIHHLREAIPYPRTLKRIYP